MQKLTRFLFLFLITQNCIAQETPADSVRMLDQVIVTAFEQNRKITSAPVAAARIDLAKSDRTSKTSLVNVINSVAGVRMEERSPGSFRINIRGSSLRSPFGVRNVKVYWNDIPVTDPGGNTYFNQFAYNNFSSIEIFKGPVSSMYGAGTGGLILLRNEIRKNLTAEGAKGSFNTQNYFLNGGLENVSISFAHNETDGYRDHSGMRRNNASFVSRHEISERQQLTAAILFTDLYYQTPGGLTKAEFDANPKGARPAVGTQPSADQAKAAIFQKNFLAGINNVYSINSNISN
ncbi:MAG TPA: TonB-dependent receptor, partial [Chitinophagaceae bacterium]|nr:TonB-dependent receptor [Chitinophagaceae bacterium]